MKKSPQKPLNVIEIAKLAGSSKSAVSRVLRNQAGVAPEIRARIQHIIDVHHFRPSVFGRGLAGASTGLIGVLGRWMGSGFAAEVIRGIDDEVKKRGGHLLVTFAPGIDEYIGFWKSFVMGRQVDGLILIAPPLDLYEQTVPPAARPFVVCASRPAAKLARGWDCVPSVTLENRRPMTELVDQLVARGYRKLVHLAGPPDIYDGRERASAFRAAVRQHEAVKGALVQGAWTAELGRSVVSDFLAAHPSEVDAFLCFNDDVALGVLQVLGEKHIAVPEEIAVTGWDDVPFSSYAGLTTVHMPMVEVGWELGRSLMDEMDAAPRRKPARQSVLSTPVMFRATSGA